jgi:hypothetical protein
MRLVWLGVALLPYVILAGIDTWMHERSRRVPRVEQALHAGLALGLIVFLSAAFGARTTIALTALCVFAALAAADEFGFHRHLAAQERRVHFASYAAMLGFVATWHWIGEAP